MQLETFKIETMVVAPLRVTLVFIIFIDFLNVSKISDEAIQNGNASFSQLDWHCQTVPDSLKIWPPVLAPMMLPGPGNKHILYEHH